MEKREQLYEGKAKKVFATDDADLVIVDYKDDATAFNGPEERHHSRQGRDQQPAFQPPDEDAGEKRRAHPLCGGDCPTARRW